MNTSTSLKFPIKNEILLLYCFESFPQLVTYHQRMKLLKNVLPPAAIPGDTSGPGVT